MPSLHVHIPGIPVAQPRTRIGRRGKHAHAYDPGTANVWKHLVAHFTRRAWEARGFPSPAHGAIGISMSFFFMRPASHFNKTGTLRSTCSPDHLQKPDVDNLAKAVLDALIDAGLIVDDALVTSLQVSKGWATSDNAGGLHMAVTIP